MTHPRARVTARPQVGGLDHYIRALKEMIFLPLTYPELFSRFGLSPPRGVLFYGPPGTGKTLVARALAAQASRWAGGGGGRAGGRGVCVWVGWGRVAGGGQSRDGVPLLLPTPLRRPAHAP